MCFDMSIKKSKIISSRARRMHEESNESQTLDTACLSRADSIKPAEQQSIALKRAKRNPCIDLDLKIASSHIRSLK